MKLSLRWLEEFVDLKGISPEQVAEALTQRGLEVEAVEPLARGWEQVITAQVLEKARHPQADRLSVCRVSTGSGDPLPIVCGAQNCSAGDKVALAQVGALLPNGMKIAASAIRGETSHGMLCSESELGLADSSEGILILPPETALGQPLAEFLGRNDVVFTLKVTPNRGDCLSHLGVARELASAFGRQLTDPRLSWSQARESFRSAGESDLRVGIDPALPPEACPQFLGLRIDGVKVGPSPQWVVRRLEALGSRSINTVVDATNLLLFELGQPVHAYALSKLEGGGLQARQARPGERLVLLDGAEVELKGSELVIADERKAVALAGVMGGGNSEVDESTASVFLECAEFAPGWVRKASAAHQRKTDAAYRFERGVDPAGQLPALLRLADWIQRLAGGQIRGGAWAVVSSLRSSAQPAQAPEVRVDPFYFHDFLGFERAASALASERIQALFASLECRVSQEESGSGAWRILPPSYRLDLRSREDLAEEVARCVGYDQIPVTIPPLSSAPHFQASSGSQAALMDQAKQVLVRQGLRETVNFAFTSAPALEQLGLKSPVRLLNPLSEELAELVPSLLPGLIRNALHNWHHHFGSESLAIRLFELRPTFARQGGTSDSGSQEPPRAVEGDVFSTGVQERWKLAWALSGPRLAQGMRSERGELDFSDSKAIFEALVRDLGLKGARLLPLSASRKGGHPLFHPGQSAEVWLGNSVVGVFGLFHPASAKQLKCREALWLAELDWEGIARMARPAADVPQFKPWPQFPQMERDFALLVRSDVSAEKLCQVAVKAGKPMARSATVFDVYRGSQVAAGMTSVAVRVIFYDEARSLQEAETEAACSKILEAWKKELNVQLR
jgi:phenylalanyl-tRNA synthetase beta chain